MRIKTSTNTLEHLADTTKKLKFSSNAETIKLAISFALGNYTYEQVKDTKYDQQGFEIDTHILFGEEIDYYNQIIKFYTNSEEVNSHHLCVLIEVGFIELTKVLKINGYNLAKVANYILEV